MTMNNEVLNMTSKHFNLGILEKIPNMVEMQPKTHRQMMKFLRNQEDVTSFNVKPIAYMKDMVNYHMPSMVVIDDRTNIPGLIECLTHDMGVTVVLTSDRKKGIFKFLPEEQIEIISNTVH